MSLSTFKNDIILEVSEILSTDFEIDVIQTNRVPRSDDPAITYPNIESGRQSCKLIETCVLYIDIRKSTELNLSHRRETVAKLYSAFGRAMTRAARYYGGHVRGIIGDRVMIVFDTVNCFGNAVDTAVLMNSVVKSVLNRHFKHNEIKCGIGIDFGKMLITKVGVIRRGHEARNYNGLVWLGRPANVASKLTDAANKAAITKSEDCVRVGRYYPLTNQWTWSDESYEEFVRDLRTNHVTNKIEHKDIYYDTHFEFSRSRMISAATPPILITKEVFLGYKRERPVSAILSKNLLRKQAVRVAEYSGDIYGGDVVKTAFSEL